MNDQPNRREADAGIAVLSVRAAESTSRTFWHWFRCNSIDSLAVLVITLYLTHLVLRWSMTFPYDVMVHETPRFSGTDVAAIVAAVLAPWGLAQAGLIKWYMEMRVKSTNGKGNENA